VSPGDDNPETLALSFNHLNISAAGGLLMAITSGYQLTAGQAWAGSYIYLRRCPGPLPGWYFVVRVVGAPAERAPEELPEL